jgi:transmembrane sensor
MAITEKQFRQMLDRYKAGTASKEDLKILNRFFNSYNVDEKSEAADALEIRDEIFERITQKLALSKQQRSDWRPWLAWAASITVIAVVSSLLIKNYIIASKHNSVNTTVVLVTDSTLSGQKLLVELPDGSTVYLNSNSKISYAKNFSDSLREVTLIGEGFFDVVHDHAKPFVVQTENARTKVLGTAFNVKALKNKGSEITLVRGKVNVMSSSGSSAELMPNEQAVVSDGNLINKTAVDVMRFVSWKDNTIHFENTSLAEAAQILESWYGVKVIIDNPKLHACNITAKYQNESLENILKSFQFLLKIESTITDNTVIIKGKGC